MVVGLDLLEPLGVDFLELLADERDEVVSDDS